MKKAMFITTSISYGGASKMLLFVAESLREKGYDISIINLREASGNERSVNEAISVYDVEKPKNLFGKVQQLFKLYKLVKQITPDVIISFKYNPNLLATIVGKWNHVPVIISERGDPSRDRGGNTKRIRAKIYWKIINSADGAVFQTNGAKACYFPRLQREGTVIANPVFIEESFRYYTGVREKSIVSFGRLANTQKRYDVMLDAFSIFKKTHPDYVLKLYGDGPDEELIKNWINEKNLQNSVKLMGISANPIQDIQCDKIFLITSDYEGIPNSLLEAMAGGLPAVATDCTPGGARMVISDHNDGIIVPCGNSRRIADALSEFADNEEFAMRCGMNARQVIQRFSRERISGQWEEYINKVMRDKQ